MQASWQASLPAGPPTDRPAGPIVAGCSTDAVGKLVLHTSRYLYRTFVQLISKMAAPTVPPSESLQ